MEPAIQYAQTRDGVNIAFWSVGQGPAIVQLPPTPWSHCQLEWEEPVFRSWYERLARNHRVVRFDSRGTGLSDRDRFDYSLDTLRADLDAVIERTGLDEFALLAPLQAGPPATSYSVDNPERVTQLMLWCTFTKPSDFHTPQLSALRALATADWKLYTEVVAHALATGWESVEANRIAAYMREATTWASCEAAGQAFDDIDVTALLGRVQVPTMVLQRRDVVVPPPAVAQSLAARIPGARLVLLDGQSLIPGVGDFETAANAVDAFTLGTDPALREDVSTAPIDGPALRIILCTDVEGHTAMMQSLGDDRGRQVLREHDRITRQMLAQHGGSEVKTMGDGFLASFGSAQRALQCAIGLQRALADSPQFGSGDGAGLRVRIGLNAGEPIEEDDDIYGTSVIAAARIAAMAQGGEILVSNVVRELAAGKGFLLADRGAAEVRGLEEPVRLYELHWAA